MLILVGPVYTKLIQVLFMLVFQGKSKSESFGNLGYHMCFSYARFSGLVDNWESWVRSEYFLSVFVCKVL